MTGMRLCTLFLCLILTFSLVGQEKNESPLQKEDEALKTPEKVDVTPVSEDSEISARLVNIFEATGWFKNPGARVEEGVVFLSGITKKEEYKKWAGDLAGKTEDVAAVVNQIDVHPSIWDYSKSLETVSTLGRRILQAVPSIILGLLILGIAWLLAYLVVVALRFLLRHRVPNPLLRKLISQAIGVLIFLIGIFIVFEIAGLTAMAFTIIGGTGILGIILGIAFKDITENILASIFLSVQNPFSKGDLIEFQGLLGYVQSLTMRATILLTLDGNHLQIPNAMIYKGTIQNFTSNPKRREDFIIGIGYSESIPDAQKIALNVLTAHQAVLDKPEPWVLVDGLGSSAVNLRIYFWLDGSTHSWLKVRSSVIRMIKRAYLENGIEIPDEGRELLFPKTLSVDMVSHSDKQPKNELRVEAEEKMATDSEDGLHNDSREMQEDASDSRSPEEGENLL